MKQTTLMSLLQKDFTTIHVAFRQDIKDAQKLAGNPAPFDSTRAPREAPTPRLFTYKSPLSEDVKVDDYVVVEGPNGGPMCALVFKVDDKPQINVDADFEYKWIVQRINRESYEDRLKREKAFLETMQQVEAEHQRKELIDKFTEHLPEDSEARRRFENAVAGLNETPAIEHSKPTTARTRRKL